MQKRKIDLDDIQAVIFDMDGTMVDNNEFHIRGWQEFYKKRGKILTREEFMDKFIGRSNKQLVPMVIGKDLTEEEIEKYGEEKEKLYRELYAAHVRPIAGLHDFLAFLSKKRIKVAVTTGSPPKNRDLVLKELKLENSFDVIVGGEDIQRGKPEPDAFLATAEKLQVQPENCIVFEDAVAGITAARRAGMKVVALTTSHKAEELKEADLLIEDFTQLDCN